MELLVLVALVLGLHALAGWPFAAVAAFLGGVWQKKNGGRMGALAVMIAWAGFMAWTYWVNPNASSRMFETMSAILGNLPAFAYPILTLVFGGLLGLFAGGLGTQARLLWEEKRR